jgi:dTDP-4-amino-4,6-dideoxygalactose transaminase
MQSAAALFSTSLPEARYRAHQTLIDAAVAKVFSKGQFILGEETSVFETEFARFLGARYCRGVGTGTDALELALRACDIGPGDAVLTVSWTATATVAAIERAGAIPVLVDIDEASFTMDPAALEEAIAEHLVRPDRGWPRLKAVLVVHLYGHPANMPRIVSIARRHGLRVIEDCAQAHGATLDGQMTGTWGDLGAFSFYPTKNLGAFGDAGAVVTNDATLAEKVRMLREYGWQTRQVSAIPGVNSRLDELQAAILRVLLPHLPAENASRRALAARYHATLAGSRVPQSPSSVVHAFHQYVVRTGQRDALKDSLQARGILTQVHYPRPVHLQPAYHGRLLHGQRGLPRTEAVAQEVLSLPMSPYLTGGQIEAILDGLSRCKKFV